MNKRLRKKKRLGEFREDCFAVCIRWTDTIENPAIEDASWRIVSDCVEPAKLSSFGAGRGDRETMSLSRHSKPRGCTEADRETVRVWLAACPEVAAFVVGPLIDAWHSPDGEIGRMYDDLEKQVSG